MGAARTFIGSIRKALSSFEIKSSIKPVSLGLLGLFLLLHETGGKGKAGMGINTKKKQS